MSKRRDRWVPVALPGVARAQARALQRILEDMHRNQDRWQRNMSGVFGSGVNDESLPALRAFMESQQTSKYLETATFFWVTDPMATVAMDASTDVPEIYPDRDMPALTGLMGFEKPLPPLPSLGLPAGIPDESGLPHQMPVSALLWRTYGEDLMITAYAWTGHLPPRPPTAVPDSMMGPLTEITTVQFPRHAAQDLEKLDTAPENRALLAFLTAAWVLMMTPTVAHRKQLDPKTGGEPRPGAPEPTPMVTTIDLRPLRNEDKSEHELTTGRVYQHRWFVRGHWRQQAHGPGRTQRRLTWIPSHLKGPEGAPILASEKVMVWHR